MFIIYLFINLFNLFNLFIFIYLLIYYYKFIYLIYLINILFGVLGSGVMTRDYSRENSPQKEIVGGFIIWEAITSRHTANTPKTHLKPI